MVLRFRSTAEVPEYIAFDTETKIYTKNPKVVKQGRVRLLSQDDFDSILSEIDFNAYNYGNNLFALDPIDDLPF